jgi:hypothetical protein
MILLQREVTCIVVIDGCVGHFLPDCFSARRQEDRIVLAPHDQCARLMCTQLCLPYGKRSDVIWDIKLQVDHDPPAVGIGERDRIVRPGIWIEPHEIARAMSM